MYYSIYFEKKNLPILFFPSYLVCSLKIQKIPKGARKKRVYLKYFGFKSITYKCFGFCFSFSSLLGGLNWIWTDKRVIKVFFSFRLCSTVEEGGRSEILPPHLLAFQPRHTCSSEASFFRVFQEKKKTKDFSSLPKFSYLPVSIVFGAT